MTGIAKIVQALKEGDVNLLDDIDVDEAALSDDSISVALRRAAERVVWHRLNYRSAIQRALEMGVPCDVWTAARAGLLDQVQKLVATDSGLLDAKDESGRTPLQRAALLYGACEECEQVVDFLLESGAKVDIFTAASYGMPAAVHAELQRSPDLVSERCEGATPLGWAVRPRRNHDAAFEICTALIDANADVHAADKYESDMTPLHHAAEWGPKICLKLVDLLVESGADLNAKDSQGWTALGYAKDRGREEMIKHLTNRGAT